MTANARPPVRLPSGTVTFMLTDIEQSTAAWESDREAMGAGVTRHYELIDAAVRAHRGVRPVEQGEGDSVVAVFTRATDALRAACDLQLAMEREPWPAGAAITVRVALHTGEAQLRDEGNYMGRAVIRAARLRAIGHGGQILCSRATAEVVADDLPTDLTLTDLGSHRLRDLGRPERVFELRHPSLRGGFAPLRSLDSVPNNLPVHLTSFIGRTRELAEIGPIFARSRLLTLTGAGGCGKTRLAAQIAAEMASNFADGAWWVELAPLTDPGLVTQTLLDVLGVPDAPGRSAAQRLIAHFADRSVLVVLDNCEHVLAGCRDLAEKALRGCSGLMLLATSREVLGVPGEVTWHVPPLGLPAREGPVPAESLGNFDAVRLFVDRAVQARPNFTVTNDTAPVVAEICARLDGIPLAIELAAARVRMLSPHQILAGLEDRFRLLTGGSRSGLPHQQTLQASVVWSHDLLTDDERLLLRRLAVFAGGFTLDAAEAVCAGAGDGLAELAVFDLLDGLVAKSLVAVHDGDGGEARYGILETIRQFAALQLRQAGETAVLRDAHLHYYGDVAERAEKELQAATAAMAQRLAVEQDNYRAALDWALAGSEADTALRLATSFAFLLSFYRGRHREAAQWLDRATVLPGAGPTRRAAALWVRGFTLWAEGDADGLTALSAQIVALAEEAGASKFLARGYELSMWVQLWVDPAGARKTTERMQPLAEETDDIFVLQDIASEQGAIAMRSDELDTADEALARGREGEARWGGDFFRSWNRYQEGGVALRRGELERAAQAAAEAARLSNDFGDASLPALNDGIAATIALRRGDAAGALAIADRALAHCEATGTALPRPLLSSARAAALAVFGDPGAGPAFTEAVKVADEVGDYWQHAQVAIEAARHLVAEGKLDGVADLLAAARRSGELLGSRWVQASCSGVAGLLASARDEPGRAEDLHHAALALHVAGGYGLGVVDELEALAGLAAGAESWAEAARLLGATARRRDELGYRHGTAAAELAAGLARTGLGPEAFEAARADGAALSIDAALAYATRARGERKRPSSGWASLTRTELEVVRLAAEGKSNAEIGQALFITAGTAKGHLSNVYAKLGLANRAELAAEATRRGDVGTPVGKRRSRNRPSAPDRDLQ